MGLFSLFKKKKSRKRKKVSPKIQKTSSNKDNAKGGEFWSINDSLTRGHKSLLIKQTKAENKKGIIRHTPITHSAKTRNINNILLKENPDKNDNEKSHVLPKVQKSNKNSLGKKHKNMKITNPIDKSVIRHIKKTDKQKKEDRMSMNAHAQTRSVSTIFFKDYMQF